MDYVLIKSDRKTASITVNDSLQVVVRAPKYARKSDIDRFVNSNVNAIMRMLEHKKSQLEKYNVSDYELSELIKSAKKVIPERVDYYSDILGLKPTAVKITKAKKRFGSCSSKNSLCFSCYLMLYPPEAVDYVVVHELAHIKHHNHSKSFYNLIEKYMPDYKQREKLLKADN